jgi:hypothetical protein
LDIRAAHYLIRRYYNSADKMHPILVQLNQSNAKRGDAETTKG